MERVILVGVEGKGPRKGETRTDETMAELARLVETADGFVAGTLVQRLERYHPATLIGPGKVEELAQQAAAAKATTVVFDDDLTPAQQRTLEELLKTKVLDRTRVILDIFARRARTREGKLQVELAQLEYRLPRITERFGRFEQQTGGIGTRGPGERKLEVDRRRIRERITRLNSDIDRIAGERTTQRAGRLATPVPVAALVGYTNAGKSTLLNTLVGDKAGDQVYADDKLFATLDPTTRRVRLPEGGHLLVTDTVGFIVKLPHSLVAAFRATLEEILHADVLIHVVDASAPAAKLQRAAVEDVLKELGAGGLPMILALNKMDALSPSRRRAIRAIFPEAVTISAKTGEGLDHLLEAAQAKLGRKWLAREVKLSHDQGALMDEIYRSAQVVGREHNNDGIWLKLRVTTENWKRLVKRLAK